MVFEFEIPDDVVASCEQWLSTQFTVAPDPQTGTPRYTRRFADVQELFETTLLGVCHQACTQFPTEALKQQLIAQKQAQDAFATSIRPKSKRVQTLNLS